jgi:uncharacterized protein (TIGR02145 family)
MHHTSKLFYLFLTTAFFWVTIRPCLATKATPDFLPPTLTFDGHQFINNGNTVNLQVQIKNIGDETATNVRIEYALPISATAIGKDYFIIDEIKPGASLKGILKFAKPANDLKINCLVTEGSTQKEIRQSFVYQANSNRGLASNTELIWMQPDPDMVGSKIVSDKDVYDIKLKAISNNKLKAQNFTVYINNTSQDGSKFEEGELVTSPSNGARKRHTYSGKLKLQKGVNRIFIEVTAADGSTKTRAIEIHYNPKRSNLHVLAIGPSHKDLQFTGNDAKDFANAFANQKNRIFKEVFIHTLTGKEKTNKASIQRAIYDLQNNYENDVEEKITDNDVLIVFISSHGKKYGRDFKILSSAYEFRYPQLETVDYEQDILRVLENIDCKKMIFIDACNSGSAKDWGRKSIADAEMAKALHTLVNAKAGLSTITSCQKNELSYEDESWQNGAFTEAILAAFANHSFLKNGKIYQPDANGNRIITLGELKNYILAYVPHLVKKQRPDAITSQKPLVAASELNMDIPIYALDSYVHQEYTMQESETTSTELATTDNYIKTYTPPATNVNPALLDSDQDGISDKMDQCPHESGPMSNNGCPIRKVKTPTGPASGNHYDDRNKKYYKWQRLLDGKKWMVENLNYPIKKESWCLDGKNKNCSTYGRLYSWQAAQNACPKGWRLPTKSDWNALINLYGGEKAAYEALISGGKANFAAQFSGMRDTNGRFCCTGSFGRYWTKDNEVARAYYFDFNKLNNEVTEETEAKNSGFSCRCVQDAK